MFVDLRKDIWKFGRDSTAPRSPCPARMEHIPFGARLIETAFSGRVVSETVDDSIPQWDELTDQLRFTRRNQVGFGSLENHEPTREARRL